MKLTSYPLSYVFSGRYYWGDGELYAQGASGRWWSYTANSNTRAYYLCVDSSRLIPQHNDNKYDGFTIRCVAES